MYSPQDPYSSQNPYAPPQNPYSSPQNPYAAPSSGAAPYSSQNPYAAPPSGAAPYPPQGPYASPPPGAQPYPSQYPYMAPPVNVVASNPRAKRAMIQGFISLAFSLLTLFTLVGYAGLITGTLAIIYGFIGLNAASRLPNNAGRGQALAGIVLGFIAWGVVILSFIIRSAHGTSG